MTPPRCLSWRVVGEGHVRAELLEASFALWAGSVRVDHKADCGEIARLVPGNCRAHLGDTADDLMARDNWVYGGLTSLHSLRTEWRSEWQIPQKRISICTSCSVGSRRGIVVEASGDVALAAE